MIKAIAILLVLCGVSVAYSIPSRNSFMYYQQPGYMYQRQAMHGIHYQNQQLRNRARSTGVYSYAARNNIAAGRYQNDLPAQDPNVSPVGELYPDEQTQQVDVLQDEQFPLENVPQYDDPDFEAEESSVGVPAVSEEIPNKKTKKVQLDSEEEEQDTQLSHRGASRPATPSAYFPLNFGSTNGAAIAIANSYSTGKGGSAVSTASAYGSPAAAELRRLSPAQLRRRPALLRTRQ